MIRMYMPVEASLMGERLAAGVAGMHFFVRVMDNRVATCFDYLPCRM